MKKSLMTFICLTVVAIMLAACGSPQAAPASAPPAPTTPESTPQRETTPPPSSDISVTVSNNTTYIFNELFVTPTASDAWGDDHLGSTSILKSGGSFAVTLQKYEFDNYDLRIVDEDKYVYLFSRVTLLDGSQIIIEFSDTGLQAVIVNTDGSSATVEGSVSYDGVDGGTGNDGTPPAEDPVPPPAQEPTGTGYDTNGQYSFTVFNESAFSIYSIHMGVRNASSDYDIDILPSILEGNSNTVVSGQASQGDWLNTEWTLYIKDMDGDTSHSYDSFNPWLLSYVDIYWDNGGYVCEFHY